MGVSANTEGSMDKQKNKPMGTGQAGYRDVAQKKGLPEGNCSFLAM